MAMSLIPHTAAAAGRNATQTASRGIFGVRSLPDFRVTRLDSVIRDNGLALVMAEGDIADGRSITCPDTDAGSVYAATGPSDKKIIGGPVEK